MTSIMIPDSVTSIDRDAFSGCYRLIEVINRSSLNITSGNKDCGYVGFYAKHIITDIKDSYLTTDDNGYIFYDDGCNIYLMGYTGSDTELVLPKTSPKQKNYKIYKYAFFYYTPPTSVTIPNTVMSIGESAFEQCNLKEIQYIGTKAQWKTIEKGPSWNHGTDSYTVHCTDGDIPKNES